MAAAPRTAAITRLLHEHGLRATAPRRDILNFLRGRREHLTTQEIYRGLRRSNRPVSVATLYQNLHALVGRGLLKRFAGPNRTMRYEVNVDAHHHLVCDRCGRIADVEVSGERRVRPVLPNAASRTALQGWQVRLRHMEFHGLCPACRRAAVRVRAARTP